MRTLSILFLACWPARRRSGLTSSSCFPTTTRSRRFPPTAAASRTSRPRRTSTASPSRARFSSVPIAPTRSAARRAPASSPASTRTSTASSTTTLDSFDGAQPTFPKYLQQAGYQTAIIGKWHLVSNPTGFDYWEILPGQGSYYNPDFIQMDGIHQTRRRLRHRHHRRQGARLAQEPPRQGQALRADVPAQGPPPQLGAGANATTSFSTVSRCPSRRPSSTTTRTAARR